MNEHQKMYQKLVLKLLVRILKHAVSKSHTLPEDERTIHEVESFVEHADEEESTRVCQGHFEDV